MLKGYAFFVKNPRRIEDLIQPHLIQRERPYQVVNSIYLSKIDFENFTTDMEADRFFLEANAGICDSRSNPIRCLLVVQKRTRKGVLVVPNGAWVDIAAIFPEGSYADQED